MEIIIGKTAGFCFGVANAVNKTEQILKECKDTCCLGELVHNKQVIEELQNKGLVIIKDINQAKHNAIIRAHGEPKETYEEAKKLGINILDLTCPKVLKIHNIAKEYENKGYYILLIGQRQHPETIGTISYCGENSSIIEGKQDIEESLNKLYNSNIRKVLILSQTTYNIESFNEIVDLVKENTQSKELELEIKNTICNATKLRQEETKEIASRVDMMIIIGGKNSSNTNKLYQICNKYCSKCILIEAPEELDLNSIKEANKIGIMAGASTPQKSIDSVVEMLQKMC